MPDTSRQMPLFAEPKASAAVTADSWEVRRSRRARRLAIYVLPHGGVEIVAPHGVSAEDIQAFVTSQKDWISKARAKVLDGIERQGPLLPSSIELKALGRTFEVHYSQRAKSGFNIAGDRLEVFAPEIEPPLCWPVMKQWLRTTGKRYLPGMLAERAERTGLAPARVQVRNQKTRWGSCSSHGTISLNAAILLLEPQQADYVLIHELCHLRHMNHSNRFWSLVGRFVPDYRALDEAVDNFWFSGPAWPR